MARRLQRLLVNEDPGRWPVGVGVALLWVAVTTALVYPLKQVAPEVSLGVVYLIAVLVISANWGVVLGLATAVASALAFNFFHIPPTGRLTIQRSEDYVALGAFLAAAVFASSIAQLARARTVEAEQRRREADLAAELARLLLRGHSLDDSLPTAAQRLAQALELPSASIALQVVEGDERTLCFPLREGTHRLGTVTVPAGTSEGTLRRLQERVVPALEALLSAALERDALQAEAIEAATLRRDDTVKTALLRVVSHDLRSPLTAIAAASGPLDYDELRQDERAELVSVIRTEVARLSRLVDNLLDLSRLEAGAVQPRHDDVDIGEIVQAAIDDSGLPREAFTVALDGRDVPFVDGDAAQLERAFANVLENAVHHAPGQPVSVHAHAAGDRLTVRVVDTGPGIPANQLEQVFEPFHRADETSQRGSGLGLAIARGFVEAGGGRLTAESLPGQGTSFVFELPLVLEQIEDVIEVVDDDPDGDPARDRR